MALADIIKRIADDAERQAEEIVLAAETDVERMRHEAEKAAAGEHERILAHARGAAEADAATLVAGARLRGRDRLVTEKRVLIDRVLLAAVERLRGLEAPEYARFIAKGIAEAARGGETIVLAKSDEGRLRAHLPDALKRMGIELEMGDSSSAIAEGVMLVGDRMRVEISPTALIASRRAELETVAADQLFAGAEE